LEELGYDVPEGIYAGNPDDIYTSGGYPGHLAPGMLAAEPGCDDRRAMGAVKQFMHHLV
jgi:hypothetical protein